MHRPRSTRRAIAASLFALCALGGPAVQAQPTYDGWLCCSMRANGDWISDINYIEANSRLIPAGTPVSITGHGRYRVHVRLQGEDCSIGNDYSRGLRPAEFTERYVVRRDPRPTFATWPQPVQRAVQSGRVRVGMTRAQTIAALGWPVASENPPELLEDAPVWLYWLWSFDKYRVEFDRAGRVRKVEGSPDTLARVLMP